MSASQLEDYLRRPMTPPAHETLRAIEAGAIDAAQALGRHQLDRLLDAAPPGAENGWCTLPDGCGYVAVATAMPEVSGEMVDWWFDWHPREALRYRVWHPAAHFDNASREPAVAGAKPYWGQTHYPVEDVGVGVAHVRIDFLAPTAVGFGGDHLDDPRAAAIVCGYAGDDRRRLRHTLMVHVFVAQPQGVLLRSRFWLGAALRPYAPGPLADLGERLLNRPPVRRRALPARAPRVLARHCAEEYANLATLLPELYARFGPGG